MICEKVIGNIKERKLESEEMAAANRHVMEEYADFEWHEVFKKLHKKTTDKGTELGIRLEDEILTKGLRDGDILYEDERKRMIVRLLPCRVIVITPEQGHDFMLIKAAYEIGNRHAPLFFGATEHELITPFEETMLSLLGKLHGLCVTQGEMVLDFDRRLSASAHHHSH